MQTILPPIGGGSSSGKSPRTIDEFNRHVHNEIRRLKGLPLDYKKGKEGKDAQRHDNETEGTKERSGS